MRQQQPRRESGRERKWVVRAVDKRKIKHYNAAGIALAQIFHESRMLQRSPCQKREREKKTPRHEPYLHHGNGNANTLTPQQPEHTQHIHIRISEFRFFLLLLNFFGLSASVATSATVSNALFGHLSICGTGTETSVRNGSANCKMLLNKQKSIFTTTKEWMRRPTATCTKDVVERRAVCHLIPFYCHIRYSFHVQQQRG